MGSAVGARIATLGERDLAAIFEMCKEAPSLRQFPILGVTLENTEETAMAPLLEQPDLPLEAFLELSEMPLTVRLTSLGLNGDVARAGPMPCLSSRGSI
jgi:hypothetical protein